MPRNPESDIYFKRYAPGETVQIGDPEYSIQVTLLEEVPDAPPLIDMEAILEAVRRLPPDYKTVNYDHLIDSMRKSLNQK